MSNEDDVNVACSDEEQYDFTQGRNTYHLGPSWHPPSEDIIQLYGLINEKGIIELDWKCPGRRSPSPPAEDVDSRLDKVANEEEDKPATEFDFDDLFSESVSPAKAITPRRSTPGSAKLRGSGQKRVASFSNVMLDIRRQMRLEKLDQTPSKSGPPGRGRKLSLPKSGERGNASQHE